MRWRGAVGGPIAVEGAVGLTVKQAASDRFRIGGCFARLVEQRVGGLFKRMPCRLRARCLQVCHDVVLHSQVAGKLLGELGRLRRLARELLRLDDRLTTGGETKTEQRDKKNIAHGDPPVTMSTIRPIADTATAHMEAGRGNPAGRRPCM
jgi:hypothetical protein